MPGLLGFSASALVGAYVGPVDTTRSCRVYRKALIYVTTARSLTDLFLRTSAQPVSSRCAWCATFRSRTGVWSSQCQNLGFRLRVSIPKSHNFLLYNYSLTPQLQRTRFQDFRILRSSFVSIWVTLLQSPGFGISSSSVREILHCA